MKCIVVFALMVFCTAPVWAQSAGTGALAGTVTDPTGAVIPGVTVTATHTGTGLERTAISREDGSYRFSLLPPGAYKVKFVNPGFKPLEVPAVTVNVEQTAVLNHVLEVGGQNEVVQVEAQAEVLQTATSTLGTVMAAREITSLPLTSRNYTQIIGLSSGVAGDLNNGAAFGRGTQNVSVNGSRPDQNNYQMDGVSIVNAASGSSSAQDFGIYAGIGIPNPDAIQEFKIQTSTYDASYGRNPGANVNLVTKSGTNQFHGSAFEFFRNEALNANDFFFNRNRLPTDARKQVLKQNQFGGSVGGPIKTDKLFFFGSYQGTRQRNGVAAEGTSNAFLYPVPGGDRSLPTFPAALGAALCPQSHPGDFAYLALGGPMQMACDGSNINPVALNLLRVKNADGSYYIPSSGTNGIRNVLYSAPAKYTDNQYVGNVDWLASSKYTLAGRFFYTKNPREQTVGGGQLPGWDNHQFYSNMFTSVKLTSVYSNNFINEPRISFHRDISNQFDTLPYTNQQIGLKGMIPEQTLPPVILIFGAFNIGGTLGPENSPPTQYQIADQISWTKGKHTIRAGYEYERVQWNLVFAGLGRGLLSTLSFADFLIGRSGCPPTDATCSPANPGNTNGGGASNMFFCLFCVRSGPNGIIHGYRMTNMNTFFQDDFKVSSKLTLNMGLRWEYDGTLGDKYGNLTNIWPSDLVPNSQVPTAPGTSAAAFQGYVVPKNFTDHYPAPPNGVRVFDGNFPSKNGIPLAAFAPRLGFAWQARQRVVIRGGAGAFYDRIGGDKFVHAVQEGKPYADTISFGPGTQYPSLQAPFLERPLAFAPRYFNPVTLASSNFNSPFYETIHLPLTRQYNLGMQWEFARQFVLDVGYVGMSAINQAIYNHNINTAQLASPASPVNGVTANSPFNAGARVSYLGFQPNGLQGTEYRGIARYDSLQTTVRKQFSRGLSFQGAYTWSKNLSNVSPMTGSANSNLASDLRQQYGQTGFSRPHRFIANYSWDLPFGHPAGAMSKMVEGWTLSGTTVIQSGQPMTIIDTNAGTAYGTNGSDESVGISRAQLCPGVTRDQLGTSGDIRQRLGGASGGSGYINKSAFCDAPLVPFSIAGASDFGNSGVGILLGPGQFNSDLALSKNTKIRESQNVQFRAEFFNVFNHPNFANPALQRNTPGTFGTITTQAGNPRIIQFALRYSF